MKLTNSSFLTAILHHCLQSVDTGWQVHCNSFLKCMICCQVACIWHQEEKAENNRAVSDFQTRGMVGIRLCLSHLNAKFFTATNTSTEEQQGTSPDLPGGTAAHKPGEVKQEGKNETDVWLVTSSSGSWMRTENNWRICKKWQAN